MFLFVYLFVLRVSFVSCLVLFCSVLFLTLLSLNLFACLNLFLTVVNNVQTLFYNVNSTILSFTFFFILFKCRIFPTSDVISERGDSPVPDLNKRPVTQRAKGDEGAPENVPKSNGISQYGEPRVPGLNEYHKRSVMPRAKGEQEADQLPKSADFNSRVPSSERPVVLSVKDGQEAEGLLKSNNGSPTAPNLNERLDRAKGDRGRAKGDQGRIILLKSIFILVCRLPL